MKKSLFLLAIIAGMFVGCKKEVVSEEILASQIEDTEEESLDAKKQKGITVTFVSWNADQIENEGSANDVGLFSITYTVRADKNDVYISSACDIQLSGVTTGKTTISIDRARVPLTAGVNVVLTNLSNNRLLPSGNYLIKKGETARFRVTAAVHIPAAGNPGQYRMVLNGFHWDKRNVIPRKLYQTVPALDYFMTYYLAIN